MRYARLMDPYPSKLETRTDGYPMWEMTAHTTDGRAAVRFVSADDVPEWMERNGYRLTGPDTWERPA